MSPSSTEHSELDVKSKGHIPEDGNNSLEESLNALRLNDPQDNDKSSTSHTGTEKAHSPATQPPKFSEPLLQDGCLPLYRVIHCKSMGHYRRHKGIRAGDGGKPPCSTYDEFMRSINDHGWNRTQRASPWISVTVDLLRAFNFAWQLHCEGKSDIVLVIIDPLKLAPGSFMSCNVLRKKFGLEENGLFKTEVLVWQNIPASAIVGEWTFEALQKSQLYKLFPGIPTAKEKRKLEGLRNSLRPKSMNPLDSTQKLLITFISDLEMDPSSMVTTQVALTMLAWTVDLRRVHCIVDFEYVYRLYPKLRQKVDFGLWALFRDELSGWDRHVLTRDGKRSVFHRDNWRNGRGFGWKNGRKCASWTSGNLGLWRLSMEFDVPMYKLCNLSISNMKLQTRINYYSCSISIESFMNHDALRSL